MTTDLSRPLPGNMSVLAARDEYLRENGFSAETYDAKGSNVNVFGIDFYRPLTDDARRAIRRHDLHHLATGYGTDLAGESEISAWEIGRGLRGLGLYVRFIVTGAALLGVFSAPRRMWQAYRAGGGGGCLFAEDDYEALLKLDLATLRARLGIPPRGLAGARRLHVHAPKAAAVQAAS